MILVSYILEQLEKETIHCYVDIAANTKVYMTLLAREVASELICIESSLGKSHTIVDGGFQIIIEY